MTEVFIASQALAAIALVLNVVSVQIKSAKKMRLLMAISAAFRGVHFSLLGSPQAAWISYLTGFRWFSSIFSMKRYLMILFIIGMLALGYANYNTLIDILPIISGTLGTVAAFIKSDRHMRILIIIAMILWVIHNIIIFTPVGIISSVFFLISNIIGYQRFYHHKHICLYNC